MIEALPWLVRDAAAELVRGEHAEREKDSEAYEEKPSEEDLEPGKSIARGDHDHTTTVFPVLRFINFAVDGEDAENASIYNGATITDSAALAYMPEARW